MPIQTREMSLETVQNYTTDHDCPYAERLVGAMDPNKVGSRVIETYRLSYFLEELASLHSQRDCPPTHFGPTSPTREWADWVHDTAV